MLQTADLCIHLSLRITALEIQVILTRPDLTTVYQLKDYDVMCVICDVCYIFYLKNTYCTKSVLKLMPTNGRIYIERWKDVFALQ